MTSGTVAYGIPRVIRRAITSGMGRWMASHQGIENFLNPCRHQPKGRLRAKVNSSTSRTLVTVTVSIGRRLSYHGYGGT